MAEFISMLRSNGTEAGHYRLDDIVYVAEDGHPWTAIERSRFFLTKVPGVPAEKLQYLREPGTTMRRKWQINTSTLPALVRARGVLVVGTDLTVSDAESRITNKETMETGSFEGRPEAKVASLLSRVLRPFRNMFA